MDKIKVSILVPAYNVEAYIEECLQSLISQTLREIEVIVVDDGSTDQTAVIAERYAITDSRIRVIRLPEHQGVSQARNVCLEESQGEYLAFVDSDDYISSDAMEQFYTKAVRCQADIVLGSILYCYPDGRQMRVGDKSTIFHTNYMIMSGQECFIRMQQKGRYVPMVCGNLYRTAFVKEDASLHFAGTFHEDEYFTPFALYKAERVTDLKKDFYYYRQHPKSIMHRPDNLEQRIAALLLVIEVQNTLVSSLVHTNFKQALQKNILRLSQNIQKLQGCPPINIEKKQLLLFTRKNRASRYGIGTYVKELVSSIDLSIWDVHIIELYADTSEYTFEERDGIWYSHFPAPDSNKADADEIYQTSIFYWIAIHYPSNNLYCHFNFTADKTLALLLKEKLNANTIFTLHYMEWKFYLEGRSEDCLQQILSHPQSKRDRNLISSFQQEKDFLSKCCDRIIVASRHSCELLQSVYGIAQQRLFHIPHGLYDTYRKRSEQELEGIRKKYHFSQKDKIILHVGRLTEDKGIHLLIAAFKLLQEQHNDIRLVIAGGGDYEQLMKIANPLWGKIIFTGYLEKEQLEELYAISTLGVVPSFHEELGYVAIEMMMHKLPLVCSDASGLKEVTDKGKCAIMMDGWCNSNKLFPLKEVLEKILYETSHLEELKEKGRNRYLLKYAQNIYQEKIGLFYK